jgi:hypothetical protein
MNYKNILISVFMIVAFACHAENRDSILKTINSNIVSYMVLSKINPDEYTITCIDRMGVKLYFKDNPVNQYVTELYEKKIDYATVILDSKTDKNNSLCFILDGKTFKVLKLFLPADAKKYVKPVIKELPPLYPPVAPLNPIPSTENKNKVK